MKNGKRIFQRKEDKKTYLQGGVLPGSGGGEAAFEEEEGLTEERASARARMVIAIIVVSSSSVSDKGERVCLVFVFGGVRNPVDEKEKRKKNCKKLSKKSTQTLLHLLHSPTTPRTRPTPAPATRTAPRPRRASSPASSRALCAAAAAPPRPPGPRRREGGSTARHRYRAGAPAGPTSCTMPTSVLMSTWRRIARRVATSEAGSRWTPTHEPLRKTLVADGTTEAETSSRRFCPPLVQEVLHGGLGAADGDVGHQGEVLDEAVFIYIYICVFCVCV